MKIKIILAIMGALFLGGCGTAISTSPTLVPAAETLVSVIPTASAPTSIPTTQAVGCSIAEPEPTPVASSLFPPVSQSDYSIGPTDAPVTIIEYCDFQVPICRSMAAVVSNVVNNHPDDVRFIFRPVPIPDQLDKSQLAVRAAIAAGDQGHFWEMYDLLFQRNREWDSLSPAAFQGWLEDNAISAGLDVEQFQAALESEETAAREQIFYDSARSFNLQTLPLLIINGQPQGAFALDYNSIESTVSLITLGSRQFKECPPFTIVPSREYIATLHTEHGEVVIQLFPDKAPLAVNSFVFLARNGWFDNITFHRVIDGFMAQTGDPSGSGKGNPGYFFENEIDPDLQFDKPGVVGMANQGPDTNGSQFFITYAAAPHLDGGYPIFGQVLSGMDVLEKLTPRNLQENPSAPPGDLLISVEIEEK